ncbi:MAG TPA: flagellar biosynthetic protein FliO [Candidatus Xenobia bacterium]
MLVLAAAAHAQTPAPAPTTPLSNLPDDPTGIDWMKQITIITFFLVVTCAIAWVSGKILSLKQNVRLFAGNGRRMKIIERCMLSPQKGLVLVDVAGRTLLLGVSDHNIAMLAELESSGSVVPSPAPVDAPPSSPFQFQQVLASLAGTRHDG